MEKLLLPLQQLLLCCWTDIVLSQLPTIYHRTSVHSSSLLIILFVVDAEQYSSTKLSKCGVQGIAECSVQVGTIHVALSSTTRLMNTCGRGRRRGEDPEMVDNGGEILSFVYSLTAVHMDSLTLWQHVERMDLCNFQYDCYIVSNGLFSRIALNNIRNKTSMLDIKCWVYTFRLRCIHTIYMHIYMRNKITKIGDFLST